MVAADNDLDQTVGRLVDEWRRQQAATLEGWDFSHTRDRLRFEPPPWRYNDEARRLLKGSRRPLDLGTGGGEVLEGLAPLPEFTVASDIAPERVKVARRRLSAHGVSPVAANSMAPLPFKASAFDLVLCRNSAFMARHVHHVLEPSGVFYSQQVAQNNMCELLDELGLPSGNKDWKTQGGAVAELAEAGFHSVEMDHADTEVEFSDVGIMLWFLEAILPGRIDVERDVAVLLRLHEKRQSGEPLRYRRRTYIIRGVK